MNRKLLPLGGVLAVIAVSTISLLQRPAPLAESKARAQKQSAINAPSGAVINEVRFEGARAFDLLKAQCDFGPRPVGSAAHEKMSAWLQTQLKAVSDEVVTQQWNCLLYTSPSPRDS